MLKIAGRARHRRKSWRVLFVTGVLLISAVAFGASPYTKWEKGPAGESGFFMIGVWLQSPARAAQYKAAGINTYVGLWKGPTEAQLTQLRAAGMNVICAKNDVALKHLDDKTIIGWMHGDEPDNAQARPGGGYGPPIAPAKIVEDYKRISAADATRPVVLNLGQAVAWDGWNGRGVRTNHPEDYPLYIQGCDIASFDIYPAVHSNKQVAGELQYVARGVERLVKWGQGQKIVWNCIECTRINNPKRKATPHEVRAEVWMSIIHGSMGLIYFVHEWQPRFNEAALLNDGEMLATVTAINKQIRDLAPVLNSPTLAEAVKVDSTNSNVPVAAMVKSSAEATYVFAVAMENGSTDATFQLRQLQGQQRVEVLSEGRELTSNNGTFKDGFGPWGVHLYRVATPK